MSEHIESEPEADIEPKEYFKELKENVIKLDEEVLFKNLATIDAIIANSVRLGQKSLLERLAFTREIIEKEQQLLASGFEKYVLKDSVLKFIEKVTPKDSVKIIELERFPRVIPTANADVIEKVKALDIFDEFYVVFTDFTENDYRTEEQKKVIARNRDPIVFGAFKLTTQNTIHDRMYFITDWEDEYCDLTFLKMIDRMTTMGFKEPEKKISADAKYINDIVTSIKEKALEEHAKTKRSPVEIIENIKKTGKPSFFKRLMDKIIG